MSLMSQLWTDPTFLALIPEKPLNETTHGALGDAAQRVNGTATVARKPAPARVDVGIQKALIKLGFDPGPVNGVMGADTQAAIKRFQNSNGLPASGRLDPQTQVMLAQLLRGATVAAGPAASPAGGGSGGPSSAPTSKAPVSPTPASPGSAFVPDMAKRSPAPAPAPPGWLPPGSVGGPAAPPPPQLTPQEQAKCNAYLTSHKFDAEVIGDKVGNDKKDYAPTLDGKATTFDAVVTLLGPLTAQNPVAELHALVDGRYSLLVVPKVRALKDQMKQPAPSKSAIVGPYDLEAKAGDHKVTLTWKSPTGATSYNIYRGTSLGQEESSPVHTTNATAFIDTGLANDKHYFYRVTAVTPEGESISSNEATATPNDEGDDNSPVDIPVQHPYKTEVEYKVTLRATDKKDKAYVQPLPEAKITVHLNGDGQAQPGEVEAELNAVTAHIEKNLKVAGKPRKITIEATVSLTGKADVKGLHIEKFQAKIKGQLEVKIGAISLQGWTQTDSSGHSQWFLGATVSFGK